jgi:hypothetical protein
MAVKLSVTDRPERRLKPMRVVRVLPRLNESCSDVIESTSAVGMFRNRQQETAQIIKPFAIQ